MPGNSSTMFPTTKAIREVSYGFKSKLTSPLPY
uniref:Uncharacterized protein n=1 Tax=Rhizophora mucronata TaxID=61149 RepID=A0A2P2R126_RHIMU